MTSAADASRATTHIIARLVEMNFADGAVRIWNGPVALTTPDGREWSPTKGLMALSALKQDTQGQASPATVSLTQAADGVEADPLAFSVAVNAERRRDVAGRRIAIYRQVMTADPITFAGEPVADWVGKMSHIVTQREGPAATSILLHAESIFAEGRQPPHAYYTDQDQQARHPGDEAFELTPANAQRVLTWPRD